MCDSPRLAVQNPTRCSSTQGRAPRLPWRGTLSPKHRLLESEKEDFIQSWITAWKVDLSKVWKCLILLEFIKQKVRGHYSLSKGFFALNSQCWGWSQMAALYSDPATPQRQACLPHWRSVRVALWEQGHSEWRPSARCRKRGGGVLSVTSLGRVPSAGPRQHTPGRQRGLSGAAMALGLVEAC